MACKIGISVMEHGDVIWADASISVVRHLFRRDYVYKADFGGDVANCLWGYLYLVDEEEHKHQRAEDLGRKTQGQVKHQRAEDLGRKTQGQVWSASWVLSFPRVYWWQFKRARASIKRKLLRRA